MSADEQRVRTMAGWIGVEISKSRARTPAKPEFGLYRVRPIPLSTDLPEDLDEMWTAYAFSLEEIECGTDVAIGKGTPARPFDLMLRSVKPGSIVTVVATRWSSAYRGRRDLGVGANLEARAYVEGRPETVRQRQRGENAQFHAEHLERRKYGLESRHRAKLARNAANGDASGPVSDPDGQTHR